MWKCSAGMVKEVHAHLDGRLVGIAEALRLNGPFRCPECQKRVRIHRASEDGSNPAHAEHQVGSKTCSRSCYYQ